MDHGHVDVEVVGLLKTLPTHDAGKLQVSLCLVFGHVIFERRSLSTLEATHFTPVEKKDSKHQEQLNKSICSHQAESKKSPHTGDLQ